MGKELVEAVWKMYILEHKKEEARVKRKHGCMIKRGEIY